MKSDEIGKLDIYLPCFNSRFTASTIEGEIPLTVDFNNQSEGSEGITTSTFWDFGDGYTSNEVSPQHVDFKVTR